MGPLCGRAAPFPSFCHGTTALHCTQYFSHSTSALHPSKPYLLQPSQTTQLTAMNDMHNAHKRSQAAAAAAVATTAAAPRKPQQAAQVLGCQALPLPGAHCLLPGHREQLCHILPGHHLDARYLVPAAIPDHHLMGVHSVRSGTQRKRDSEAAASVWQGANNAGPSCKSA